MEHNNLKSQAVSGVKWSGTSVAYTTVIQFVTTAILARLLSPSDFGLMSMMFVVIGFVGFFSDVGVSGAIIAYQDSTKEQLSSLYWLNIIIGVVLFGLILMVRPVAVFFFREPRISSYLPWVAISLLVTPIGSQFAILLQKELRFKVLSRIEITSVTISSVIAIVVALLGFGIWSLVFSWVMLTISSTFIYLAIGVQYKWLPSFCFRITEVKHYLRFGLFQAGGRFFGYLCANLDHLIIGRFLGANNLGFYTLAWSLMNAPTAKINPTITRVAFPTFARIQDDDERLRNGYLKILRYVSSYSFPIMAGLFMVAPLFVPVVYGAKWQKAIPVLQVLCLLGALRSIANPFGSLLFAKGRADIQFYWTIFCSMLLFVGIFVGAKWGIVGVASSILIVVLLITWPVQFLVRWYVVRMKVREYLNSLKIPAIASGLMMILLWCTSFLWSQMNNISSLIFQIIVGATFYFVLSWIIAKPFCLELKDSIFSKQ